jgi:hypothetical protein
LQSSDTQVKQEAVSQPNGDASVPEISGELFKAESECDQLIKEVQEYNWESGPYPLPIAFPYPEADIYFFQGRAKDAHHLKTRILAVVERIGPHAEQWKQQINTIHFHEVYINEGLTPGARRPSDSGLIAARQVLRTARLSWNKAEEGKLSQKTTKNAEVQHGVDHHHETTIASRKSPNSLGTGGASYPICADGWTMNRFQFQKPLRNN